MYYDHSISLQDTVKTEKNVSDFSAYRWGTVLSKREVFFGV